MIGLLPRPRVLLMATAVLTAGGLAATGPAPAATVETRLDADTNIREVAVTALPGERNDLTLTSPDEYTVRIADPVSPLEPGTGCTRVAPTAVQCTNGRAGTSDYLYTARVLAGDGNDTVRSSGAFGPRLLADAGPGDDLLAGSGGRAHVLNGGGGIDQLFGGENADVLDDGDATGAADADVLDGGASADTVTYARRTRGVRVDLLDAATDGEPGEGDTLRAIENATGGSGNDRIDGDEERNLLRGGPGSDRLSGGRKDDTLYGGGGRDTLRGQSGADQLDGGRARDTLRGDSGADFIFAAALGESLSCGRGADSLVRPAPAVLVPATCESLRYAFASPGTDGVSFFMRSYPVRASGRTLRFRLGCPEIDGECPVDGRGRLTLRTAGGGRVIASGRLRWSLARDGRPRASGGQLRLTARGAALARRRGGVLTSVQVTTDSTPAVRWRIRLKTRG